MLCACEIAGHSGSISPSILNRKGIRVSRATGQESFSYRELRAGTMKVAEIACGAMPGISTGNQETDDK